MPTRLGKQPLVARNVGSSLQSSSAEGAGAMQIPSEIPTQLFPTLSRPYFSNKLSTFGYDDTIDTFGKDSTHSATAHADLSTTSYLNDATTRAKMGISSTVKGSK